MNIHIAHYIFSYYTSTVTNIHIYIFICIYTEFLWVEFPNSYENTYAPCKILRKIFIPFVAGGPFLVAGGPPWWQGDFFYVLKLRRIQKKSPCHKACGKGTFFIVSGTVQLCIICRKKNCSYTFYLNNQNWRQNSRIDFWIQLPWYHKQTNSILY